MKKQSEIRKVFEVNDIYQYSQIETMLTIQCIQICFRPMTEDEFKSANKLRKTKVPAIFATDYAVCIRKIEQKTTTWY